MATKTVIDRNLAVWSMQFQEAILEGFRINPDNPPSMWGVAYEAILVRDDYIEEMDSVFIAPVENVVIENVQQAKKSSAGRPKQVKV